MTVKLAAEHIEGHQADAHDISADGADVGVGIAMSAAKSVGEFRFGGQHLVWTEVGR